VTTIAAHLYKDGRAAGPLALDGAHLRPKGKDFVWIGLHDPTRAELDTLGKRFGLHPLAVEDAFQLHQFPKVDIYGDNIFVVMRSARLRQGAIIYAETHVFAGPGYIITIRHGDAPAHGLRNRLERDPVLLAHGIDRVLHGILDFHVASYLPMVDRIEVELEELEKRAFDTVSLTRFEIARIFDLRRQLLRFSRILDAMSEVCGRLEHLQLAYLSQELRLYYRDTHDHVRRVAAMVEGLREVLASVFEVSALLEQQKQSAISRKLAAWAAILAVPTAVAGVYGMNFDHMPELHWRYGYLLILVGMAGLCVYLYARFRKSGWL
jgi:magnesium transporter